MSVRSGLAIPVVALLGVISLGACGTVYMPGRAGDLPRAVSIDNAVMAMKLLSPDSYRLQAQGGLLLRDGDMVVPDQGGPPYVYRARDGAAPKVSPDDWSVTVNGQRVTLWFEGDSRPAAQAWLEQASAQELATLRLLGLVDDIDAPTFTALRRLARVNPHVGLVVASQDALMNVLPLFQPRVLVVMSESDLVATDGLRAVLAGQRHLHALLISAMEPGSLDFLASLPKLRRLIILGWDVDKAGPLPAGLDALQALTVVMAHGPLDFAAVRAAPAGLRELTLMAEAGAPTANADVLARWPRLRTLFVSDPQVVADLASRGGLRTLQWLGLLLKNAEASQQQLGTIARQLPGLRILELTTIGGFELDVAPLRDLPKLQAFTLAGEARNPAALAQYTQLRYLAVPEELAAESPEHPEQVTALRKALPNTLVTTVKPFCLGSGWILLLLPAVGLAWRIGRRS